MHQYPVFCILLRQPPTHLSNTSKVRLGTRRKCGAWCSESRSTQVEACLRGMPTVNLLNNHFASTAIVRRQLSEYYLATTRRSASLLWNNRNEKLQPEWGYPDLWFPRISVGLYLHPRTSLIDIAQGQKIYCCHLLKVLCLNWSWCLEGSFTSQPAH